MKSVQTGDLPMDRSAWKEEGFENERLIVIPTEAFAPYAEHPLVRALYPTDIGYYPNAANHHVERMRGSDQYILFYCMDGRGVIEVEDEHFELQASDALCIPRRQRHRYYADSAAPWSILWVHFRGDNATLFPVERAQLIHMNSASADRRVMLLFTLIFRALERNYSLGNFIYLSQALSLILSEIYYREKADESPAQRYAVTRAVRYMYDHMAETLTLEALSREMQMSKSYLNMIFRQQTGHAPMDFFIELKMQEACRLLEDPQTRVGEVASALGYDDPYYFSRVFRKRMKVSPRAYRKGQQTDASAK